MNRATRPVNVTLLALLVITTVSGGLAFALGDAPASTVVVLVHGAAGLGLLLLAPAKAKIGQRGLRRRGRSRKVIGRGSPRWPARGRQRAAARDRRVALRGAGLVVGATALWFVAPGRDRRFTGSHDVGSGEPAVMP